MRNKFTIICCRLLTVAVFVGLLSQSAVAQYDAFKGQEKSSLSGVNSTFNNTSYDLTILNSNDFVWQEIGSTGTVVTFIPDADDGHAFLSQVLSFEFPFFGQNLKDLAIATNGTIYFEDDYLGLQSTPIPGETSYPPIQQFIAHFWADLMLRPASKVLYQQFPNHFVVQYQDVERFGGNGSAPGTWQVVLTDRGSVIIRYKNIERMVSANPGFGSVGVQGSNSEGLQIGLSPSNDLTFCVKPDTIGANCSTAELPVEFVSLDAYLKQDQLIVDWTTASEEDNAGFEIQANSGSGFRTIGYLEGKGTTDVNSEYSFETEILSPDQYRIRVKQIDFDGSFSYSDETELDIVVTQGYVLNPVYPNPFKGETTFSFAVGVEQNVKVELFDLLGKKISTLLEDEVLENKTRHVEIHGSGLQSGIYIVRVTGDQFTATRTINLLK